MADSSTTHGASDDAHVVEPPIIDLMRWDPQQRCLVITLVPQDRVSPHPTEVVDVSADTVEGRAIAACLDDLATKLGLASSITKVVHAGGGDFTFHAASGEVIELSGAGLTSQITAQVYDLLQRISQDAEHAFLIERVRQLQSHPA